ncbi:roquin-2 isoform X2 [Brachyhypopomus gauderio]|uniref:roquin-2 isoform X2 n=1 Tax=Brachyhypopomus gauderio TaxID=698409 RepID=UPI0040432A93
MPVQAAQWTDFLSCPICYNEFDAGGHQPISLGCSHTVCKTCLHKLHRKACPFDQTTISTDVDLLPVNCALLLLVGAQVPEVQGVCLGTSEDTQHYGVCRTCVQELALYLRPISGEKGVNGPSVLSRPMQRKLVTLVHCQLVEQEGRLRAERAARSLGERSITELILQHQNPQQLSANLWAAVRARGCQFLGPAMQEDALKLVLLALEDGSALSRKVLVLFVVQKLEARFPQASKTSIGHVVQLLYRASCFKVTKRDEDSSLMQLKEEFRMYEALRREHDAQIVHIAMEAGLRISPEQWSSLLYGDLLHKSHMQSIIDKLQSPESFAKSVQELTIVLQRTGDPANLNSLRAPLELLAALDHNPDAAAPTWAELESVMLAVKAVVRGLVDFIQNFSKKNHEAFQSQPSNKYKTSMCRDLQHQGTCPRGSNCTFAHTQDELEKYRLRNKKVGGAARPTLLPTAVVPKSGAVKSLPTDQVPAIPPSHEPEVVSEGLSPIHLVPRGGEREQDDVKLSPTDGATTLTTTSQEEKPLSPPKTLVSAHQSPGSRPHAAAAPADDTALPSRSALGLPRAHHEMGYHSEQQLAYDMQSYHSSSNYYSMTSSHKPCLARFSRSSPASESPAQTSLPPPYLEQAPPLPSRYGPTPNCAPMHHPHGHGVYTPVYDSRRAWRPQLYHRQDGRSNSLPLEVLHASVYQRPLRERFNSLDSQYCSFADRRTALHKEQYGCEDLYRVRQEPHQASSPGRGSQPSPVLTVHICSEGVGGCKCGEGGHARYSPWSCDTESVPRRISTHSCTQHADTECAVRCWPHFFEPYRRMRDEDPIIPFSEGPIISKWGAISRTSRTDPHTSDPVRATTPQVWPSTTPVFRDYGSHLGTSDCRWGACGFSSNCSSFLESDQRRRSFGSGGKHGAELLVHNGTESEPDRDIELELSAVNMEDPESQEFQCEASLESGNCLTRVFTDPVSRPEADQPIPHHMVDARLKMTTVFRKSLSPGSRSSGSLTMGSLVLKTPVGAGDPGLEMLLNGS